MFVFIPISTTLPPLYIHLSYSSCLYLSTYPQTIPLIFLLSGFIHKFTTLSPLYNHPVFLLLLLLFVLSTHPQPIPLLFLLSEFIHTSTNLSPLYNHPVPLLLPPF
jgi:hypothetical protein